MPHFVIITGRTGKDGGLLGSQLGLIQAIKKSDAVKHNERVYRDKNKLPSSVALRSGVAFEGTEEEGDAFYRRLLAKIEEEQKQNGTAEI